MEFEAQNAVRSRSCSASAARTRIAQIEAEISQRTKDLEKLRHEELLLDQLIAVRTGELTDAVSLSRASASAPLSGQVTTAVSVARGQADAGSVLRETAVRILEDHGRPVHISELMRLMRKHEVVIPGAGTQANLISHVRRDSRIVRPSRGMYGLATWGLADTAGRKKSGRRKKRKRRTTSAEAT